MQMLLPLSRILGSLTLPSAGSLKAMSASTRMLSDCPHSVDVHLRHIFKNHVCED
jgi:hypothetical protein